MVAVEVDEGVVGGAQLRGGQVGAAELPEQRAGAVRPVLELQEVVIGLRGKVQELNMCTCENIRKLNGSYCQNVYYPCLPKAVLILLMSPNTLSRGGTAQWGRPLGFSGLQ